MAEIDTLGSLAFERINEWYTDWSCFKLFAFRVESLPSGCRCSAFQTADRFSQVQIRRSAIAIYLSADSTISLINFQRSDNSPWFRRWKLQSSANLISRDERRVFSVILEILPIIFANSGEIAFVKRWDHLSSPRRLTKCLFDLNLGLTRSSWLPKMWLRSE